MTDRTSPSAAPAAVVDHYGRGRLEQVARALDAAGLGDPVPWEALAPLDQFHVGGLAATRDFAERLRIAPGWRVLDLGCGLGGPARCLAATFGCAVTGLDLSPAFVEIGAELSRRTGLGDRVRHVVGDATDLPFEPDSFDLVWTQHAAMNIADRDRLYAGVARVLRPGGRLAAHDVVTGEEGSPYLPAPWARDPAQSHAVAPGAMRIALERGGLLIEDWRDVTASGVELLRRQTAARASAPLSLALVMGADFPALAANLARSLADRRARLVQVVARRPA